VDRRLIAYAALLYEEVVRSPAGMHFFTLREHLHLAKARGLLRAEEAEKVKRLVEEMLTRTYSGDAYAFAKEVAEELGL